MKILVRGHSRITPKKGWGEEGSNAHANANSYTYACVIKINILLFHWGQVGKMFLICVAKASPFLYLSCLCVSNLTNKITCQSSVPLWQSWKYKKIWMKTLLWYILFSFSKRSVITFFSNIGRMITNFCISEGKEPFLSYS